MQLTSNYLKEIAEYSHSLKKPIVLRTSTTIKESDIVEKGWLKEITLFIHHSKSNAKKLEFIENYNYTLVDQCTFKEEEMLEIKPVETFNKLLYVGRISEEKGIVDFVNIFNDFHIIIFMSLFS